MNRNKAFSLAASVTAEDLNQMLLNAKDKIENWSEPSNYHLSLTKEQTFALLTSEPITVHSELKLKVDAIREFGEYLPVR